MSLLVPITLALAAATSAADPVTACRAAHAGDPAAHIACLEKALGSGAPPPAAAKKAEPAAGQPTGLGAEQVSKRKRDRDEPPAEARVEISSVAYDGQGRQVFRMADGQVWRETEVTPERQRLKTDRAYTARIEAGKLGGFRMYVDGVRRMIKLERLQ